MVVVNFDIVNHLSTQASIHIDSLIVWVTDHCLAFAWIGVKIEAHFSRFPLKCKQLGMFAITMEFMLHFEELKKDPFCVENQFI